MGIAYIAVVSIGVARAGLDAPIIDPILAVMEVITLISAPLVVVLMASVCVSATEDRKVYGVVALSFGSIMAGLTCGVHFVALTAGRQTDFTTLEWPSTLYAVELLAWDFFLGLALLFAAPVFQGPGLGVASRRFLAATGTLCLAGVIGPILGNMALQRVGILGYGVGLPISCVLLALFYRKTGRDLLAENLAE